MKQRQMLDVPRLKRHVLSRCDSEGHLATESDRLYLLPHSLLLQHVNQEKFEGAFGEVFDHREKFRGFWASRPNVRSPSAQVSVQSVH